MFANINLIIVTQIMVNKTLCDHLNASKRMQISNVVLANILLWFPVVKNLTTAPPMALKEKVTYRDKSYVKLNQAIHEIMSQGFFTNKDKFVEV